MNTGITLIEGVVTDTKVVGNENAFCIVKPNGERITYIIPSGIAHMKKIISVGVRVVIRDTVSGPKSIITYPKVDAPNTENVRPEITRNTPIAEELATV